MKLSKKIPAMALSFAMAFSLAACGGGTAKESAAPAESAAAESAAPEAKGLKIAICTSPNTVDDGSFNEDNYDGVLSFIASRGDIDTVTPVQEPTGDPAAAAQTVSDVVADYDVLVCTGFQFAGIATIAQDNPDKYFILVDSFPSVDGKDAEVENVYAMQFAENEGGFFAGIAAALETQTGKVAVVNGVAYPSNVNYQFGFESGVAYANKNLGAKAEVVEIPSYAGTDVTGANVGGNYTGNFGDEAMGKVVGQALIQQGCDIIFVAAGASGNGVFTAAKEAGNVKVIGCDVDQYDDGANGDSNIILTSALKNMAINVERQLNAIVDGTFKGGNYTLQADTDSTGYVSADGRQQLSEATLKTLADVYPLVKDGTIVPASNFNGNTPDNFPGL
ncbi:MAG: BMP family ABC transporter substrate-binding protein [Pseudoflavonifractor sp.]|nr:BMP family ABC transporter substrate-binding protein [Pseudoflavonifractor sp.]MDY3019449.1 BMP family ABC transporter substrate-binding protein [Oscillospiraceae bacterium]